MPCRAWSVSTVPVKLLFVDVTLAVKQEKEECLVLDDWTADTAAKLISVVIVLSDAWKLLIQELALSFELRFTQNRLP